jgi:hypothetical protein
LIHQQALAGDFGHRPEKLVAGLEKITSILGHDLIVLSYGKFDNSAANR